MWWETHHGLVGKQIQFIFKTVIYPGICAGFNH